MSKQKIEWAAREKRRAVNAAVGRNFLKTITEPVTNSDSALKKHAGVPHAAGLVNELMKLKPGQLLATDEIKKAIPKAARRKILVQLSTSRVMGRDSRLCRVVDTGPGMTFEELRHKFGTYAEAKAKGEKTRSLFGRGALDVLLYHDGSVIYTVAKNNLSICKIYWDKDAFCETESAGAATQELLDRYKLPSDIRTSGTVVEFRLKEGTPIPQEEQIVDRITSFYMMRLITADPNTELVIERIRGGGVYRDRAEHDFPRGVVIGRCSDVLLLPDAPRLPVDILVARADEALQSDPIHTDRRENGLLFVDDNDAVMDMTLLPEYDKNPFLNHIYGVVRITGIRDVVESMLEAEEAELAFLAGVLARVRILHDGSQRRVGHHEAAVAASVEAVREQSEGVGVTLEVREVLPHLRRHTRLQRQSPTLAEERLYSLLAGVTERRIAHVVRQTRRANDGAKLLEERTREFGTNTLQGSRHVVAKRHAHARHFERVSQSVVHEDAARLR